MRELILKDIFDNVGKFYVYGLYRPDGTIFYVGKGKYKRLFDHGKPRDIKNCSNKLKINTIKKIRESGQDFGLNIFKFFDCEKDCFNYESKLIKYFELKRNKGVLCNLTYGGEGCVGMVMSEESRKRVSEGHKGLVRTKEHRKNLSNSLSKKPILCVEKNIIFNNLPEAARWLRENGYPKASGQNIHKCVHGLRNEAYGHTWRHVTKD